MTISEQLKSIDLTPERSGITILPASSLVVILPAVVVAINRADAVLRFLSTALSLTRPTWQS